MPLVPQHPYIPSRSTRSLTNTYAQMMSSFTGLSLPTLFAHASAERTNNIRQHYG